MSKSSLERVLDFLRGLDHARIHYEFAVHREGALMVLLVVPGERFEVEFFADGSVEVERFVSDGQILGEGALRDLLGRYAEPAPPVGDHKSTKPQPTGAASQDRA